ncbi:MAG: AAA family ATPase [Acidobacteria bacterium]|nr:AAA family ATPase [Acidobacteriota bacterium]
MFLEFYKLREQPFGVTPDPRFLYLGPTHREAMAALFCGIEEGRGFLALIAEPGMGKTTLVFQLLERLQRTSRTVFMFQTQCDSRELVRYVLNGLGIDASALDIVGMHAKLDEVMAREMLAGRRFVLVIDEAQNLDPSVLETVRLLSDFETPRAKLLQIVLAGQTQLASKLASPGLEQLRQRIGIVARLKPFDSAETARYIDHRLKTAGYAGEPLFTPEAVRSVALRSLGIPRNINNLCFNALALAYAMGRRTIDASIVEEVLADLDVRTLVGKSRPTSQPTPPRRVTRPKLVAPQLPLPKPVEGDISRRALSTAAVAALVATLMVGGLFALSSKGRVSRTAVDRPNPEAAGVVVTPAEAEPQAVQTEQSVPFVSRASGGTVTEQVAPEPAPTPAEPSAPPVLAAPKRIPRERVSRRSPSSDTFTVVVRPKDNLRQICLRYLGQYTEKLVQQILELNPGMTDPNHLAIGQEIRLPNRS